MITAIFIPYTPDMLAHELQVTTKQIATAGLKLYINGSRAALLPRPVKGWVLFAGSEK